MHKYQRITILPLFFGTLPIDYKCLSIRPFFLFIVGLLLGTYLLPPSLPLGEPLGEENVVDGVMDGWVEMLDVGCWM